MSYVEVFYFLLSNEKSFDLVYKGLRRNEVLSPFLPNPMKNFVCVCVCLTIKNFVVVWEVLSFTMVLLLFITVCTRRNFVGQCGR